MWKTIKVAPRYVINKEGVVVNSDTGKVRKHCYNERGYPYVNLSVEKYSQRKCMVHRLMAEAFLHNNNPEEFDIVLHLDDDVKNFSIDNLSWGTQKMNMEQSSSTGHYSTVKKEVTLLSPTGEVVHVRGLRPFAAEHNLDWGNFHKVVKGQHRSVKGWRLYK